MEKQNIRKEFLVQRKQLDVATYLRLSLLVQQRIIASKGFAGAKSIGLYSPVNCEVATAQIDASARELGIQVCYPRVVGKKLEFVVTESLEHLVAGSFGVAEPTAGKCIEVSSLDLLVVPGVAFNLAGYRLGYGGGYYDRLLAGQRNKTLTAGLFFESQLCKQLPVEAHDQQLDFIVTESQHNSCRI